ncbi:MAG: glycine hydroxymethyltransferase [Clostridia bacterium]|nr:glycine hydroxymethyltransferase [Clostridia bacterium]
MSHLNAVMDYIQSMGKENMDAGFLAYIANLSEISRVSPDIAKAIVNEIRNQRSHLKLIASENYCSLATQLAMGNLLTDKYAEGYPGHRNYAGCEQVDFIENLACDLAKKVFGCDHAYVQPHSGADANLIAFWAILNARVHVPELEKLGVTDPLKVTDEDWSRIREKLGNQKLLGLDLFSGGHLTHGYRHNISGRMFEHYNYAVDEKTHLINYDQIEAMAVKIKPLILLTGYSAYPRKINFRRMREIADKVNAVFMVDMAHFAGIVAGGVFTGEYNPVPYAHIVTTTTHKTLRGPRGGMILCTDEFAEHVDKGCPLVIGGPLPHVMAAKAVAFTEACSPEFKEYAAKVVDNAKAFAEACMQLGIPVSTNGTDNHLFLLNVSPFGITGRQAESALCDCLITTSRSPLPYDPNGPWYTSGLRIGTPAVTTLGMGQAEMAEIASIIKLVLSGTKPTTTSSGTVSKAKYVIDENIREEAITRVRALLGRFPVYPQLDLNFLEKHFVD